ncbi:MAG: DNA/RNA non-specific endonuclease [Alistipes sp.]|nr:DNA/RNA non-specific endonuclease [Candidatus Alistipes equi]
MKNLHKIIFTIVLLSPFIGCTNNDFEDNSNPTKKDGQPFEIIASTSRTSNDEMATLWSKGDKLTVFHAEEGTTLYSSNDEFTIEEAGAQGVFQGTLLEPLDENKEYDWYIIYPYNKNYTTPKNSTCHQVISSSLLQSEYGSMSHLAGEHFPLVGHVRQLAAAQTPSVTMQQLLSVIRLNITNNSGKSLRIEEVSFSSQNEYITGEFCIDFAKDEPVFGVILGEVSKSVSLSVSNTREIAPDESVELYLAIKPFTAKNDTLTISINGYEKLILVGESPVSFQAGKIKTINCNYDLYGEYLITGKKDDTCYAMGLYNSGDNNIKGYPLEFVNGNIYETPEIAKSKVTIRRITTGEYNGLYSIMDTQKRYLYAAGSSSNLLKTQPELNENAVWEINEDANYCSIVATRSENTHRILKFNYNGGTTLFSCYQAGQSEQSPVSLINYKTILPAQTPIINVTPPADVEASGATISVNYSITNPILGVSISAVSDQTWVNSFDFSNDGKLSMKVEKNSEVSARTANITLSYQGAIDVQFAVLQMGSAANYSSVFTSNVDLSTDGETYVYKAKVIISSSEYDALKCGVSSTAGSCQINIPTGTKMLHFHAAGWNGENVKIKVNYQKEYTLCSDTGIANNTPFTIAGDATQYYYTFEPNGATEIKFEVIQAKRFVLFGVIAEQGDKEAQATVQTLPAQGLLPASATLFGQVSELTGVITQTGFEWGMAPDNLSNRVQSTTSTSFSKEIFDLQAETTYYFRAYATVSGTGQYSSQTKTFYGNKVSFKTANSSTPTGWLELPAKKEVTSHIYDKFVTETKRNYSYCYDTQKYASIWTAYPLTNSHTIGQASTSSWNWNPHLTQSQQVNIVSGAYEKNYGNGTYARGHMCPNADRKSSDEQNRQTYYPTNQLPQIQNGFNSGIWSKLEGAVRNLTSFADTVYVAVGPCYQKVGGSETIKHLTANEGIYPSKVDIPNYFYKVLLKVRWDGNNISSASAIGFWMEHRVYTSQENNITDYTVSVDQIEEWTGIDFFANLPKNIEAIAEQNTSWTTFSNFKTATTTSTFSYATK